MTTSLTYAGGPMILPDFAELGSLDAEVVSRTITHAILDGPPVYTLRAGSPQVGTLSLHFASSARAYEARDNLTAPTVYTLASTDSPHFPPRIVVRRIGVTQREVDTTRWVVAVEYEAVV